jgi:hypothetical protein
LGEKWQKKSPLQKLGLKQVNDEKVVIKKKCTKEFTGLSCLWVGSCGRIY